MSFCDLHLTVYQLTFQLLEQLGKFMVKQNMFLRFNFDLWWKRNSKASMNLETTTQINEVIYLKSNYTKEIVK